MEQDYDLAVEELKEAKNPIEKQMLLQKYGLIDPKLTEWEQTIIRVEAQQIVGKGFSDIEVAPDAPGRTA